MSKQHDEMVVLVDRNDQQLGIAEKMSVHKGSGQLHRAVSVIVYRVAHGVLELLLQKRASEKPLWPEYWTNTICTHPKEFETPQNCAVRRLKEEMGIVVSDEKVIQIDTMYYQAEYSALLSEHELDHVFMCEYDGEVLAHVKEASAWDWISWVDVQKDVRANPVRYTPWFRMLVERKNVQNFLQQTIV